MNKIWKFNLIKFQKKNFAFFVDWLAGENFSSPTVCQCEQPHLKIGIGFEIINVTEIMKIIFSNIFSSRDNILSYFT